MSQELEATKEILKGLSDIVNSFKSESVQMKVLDVLLSKIGLSSIEQTSPKSRVPRKRSKNAEAAAPTPKGTKRSSGTGAFSAVSDLLTGDFFNKGKTIGEVVEHLQHNSGRKFKSSEISPPLLRLLRDKKLEREKNAEKQYEYSKR